MIGPTPMEICDMKSIRLLSFVILKFFCFVSDIPNPIQPIPKPPVCFIYVKIQKYVYKWTKDEWDDIVRSIQNNSTHEKIFNKN